MQILFDQIHSEQNAATTFSQKLAVLKRYDDFLRHFPNTAQAWLNRSILLQELGFYDLALQEAQKVVKAQPENAAAWCHYAFLLNLTGQFEQGWRCYEWRWQMPNFRHPTQAIPVWQGEAISDAKLLIYAEQGFGDNIQFVRYALEAKQRGLNIVVVNHQPLENLLNANLAQHGIETAPNGAQLSGVRYLVSMMSLPYLFGTTVENVPFRTPYLLPETAHWGKFHEKLAAQTAKKRLKVGVVWAGSPKHARNHLRSVSLAQFCGLFAQNAEFHCLQKEVSEADLKACQAFSNVHFWHDQLADFSDTAGLVAQMDLVICVDTAVAHLAAAMGVPTWILISHNPDYRWLLDRTDSVWYQAVTLFRQADFDHWSPTFEALSARLAEKIKAFQS